jgi:hypothetical protein
MRRTGLSKAPPAPQRNARSGQGRLYRADCTLTRQMTMSLNEKAQPSPSLFGRRALDLEAPSRRGFLRLVLALSAFLPAQLLMAAPVEKTRRRISIGALAPYLDTLIPEDSTPSASALGVDQAILKLARRRPRIARLVGLGCAWLDKQAGERGAKDFAALSELEREAIVALAEGSPARSLPRTFFAFTQQQAFSNYYAQPAAWQGLGFAGPPQPLGFLDFAEPPKRPAP